MFGKFRASKQGSHKSPAAKVTKPPRESLVCNGCRRSKLRCDRGQPCGNCVKRDEGDTCNYKRPNDLRADSSRQTVAEDRLLHLESLVRDLMQSRAPAEFCNKSVVVPDTTRDLAESFDGPRSDRIYVGSTHWSAILDDICDLKAVLGGSTDIQNSEGSLEAIAASRELIFGSSNDHSVQQILSQYLPPRVEADRLLSIYFRGETYIVPFVHTYHFQKQYRDFWTDTASVNPLWLSMLFSVCYLASLIGGATGSSPNDNAEGRPAFHVAAGKCLIIGQYHRPQQFTVEALAMYGHCKNFRTLDPSREAGFILGMVVRLGYEMGYHRDPDSFGNLSVFEGEMRRRCWSACKQMDLMISFMLGLPSNICLEDCDIKSPRNLLDSDFDADTQELPPSRSENEFTKLLWFIVKERQMINFSKVCQDALSFKEKSEAEILQLDQEIREMWTTIPEILRTRPLSESIADAPFLIMTRIYVEFVYLKSLCVLHRKYMARGNVLSTNSCVEAGKRLVRQFIDMYKEFSPGGQLYMERWMLANFTMNDFLLGVMVLCLVVHTRWKRGFQNSAINIDTESEVLSLLEQSHIICVEKSTSCRDARRVSHAIQLTLKGAKTSNGLKKIVSQTSQASPAMLSAVDDSQGGHPALNSRYGYDEEAFGIYDPFNFMGSEVENIDWAMFDQQTFGQDVDGGIGAGWELNASSS